MVAWGVRGLLTQVSSPDLLHAARLAVLAVAGHDAAFAPLCVLVGAVTGRWAPSAVRTPLRVGLGLAVVLVVLALPSITSANRLRNPSVLPLDYGRNLAVLLGLVALGVVVSAARGLARERRRRSAPPPRA